MPRVRQGGMRNGTPGTQYPNRSDLAAQPSLPARVATDQTYGKAQSQLEAQRTIPMRPAPLPLPTSQPAGGGVSTPGSPPPPAPPTPGSFGDLHRPTERPFEPVTTGIPTGPGPGPEVFTGPIAPNAPTSNNLSSLLSSIADQTGSAAVRALAAHAQAAGT